MTCQEVWARCRCGHEGFDGDRRRLDGAVMRRGDAALLLGLHAAIAEKLAPDGAWRPKMLREEGGATEGRMRQRVEQEGVREERRRGRDLWRCERQI
jgi:hypothetical protein